MKALWSILTVILFAMLMFALAASGALPPMPIPRPAPLLSPRHASQPKSTPMFKPASTGQQKLPMKWYFRKVQSEYGTFEFSAEAIQPPNHSLVFEYGPFVEGPRTPLAWFGPTPYGSQVFAGLNSYSARLFIRATATPEAPTTARAVAGAPPPGDVRVNPAVKGARAWRGVKR